MMFRKKVYNVSFTNYLQIIHVGFWFITYLWTPMEIISMSSSPNKFLQRIRKRIVKPRRSYELSPTNQRKEVHPTDVHLKDYRGSAGPAKSGNTNLDNAHLHQGRDMSICSDKVGSSPVSPRKEATLYCFQKGVFVEPKGRLANGGLDENYVYAHKEVVDNEVMHTNLMNDCSDSRPAHRVEYGTPRRQRGTGWVKEKELSTIEALNCTPTNNRKRNAKTDPLPEIDCSQLMSASFNGTFACKPLNDNEEDPIPMIDDDLEDEVSGYSSLEPSSPDSDIKSSSASSSDQSMKSRSTSESSGTCSSSNSMKEISSLESPSDNGKLTDIKEHDRENSDVFIAASPSKLKLQPHQLNIPRLVPFSQRNKNKVNNSKKEEESDQNKNQNKSKEFPDSKSEKPPQHIEAHVICTDAPPRPSRRVSKDNNNINQKLPDTAAPAKPARALSEGSSKSGTLPPRPPALSQKSSECSKKPPVSRNTEAMPVCCRASTKDAIAPIPISLPKSKPQKPEESVKPKLSPPEPKNKNEDSGSEGPPIPLPPKKKRHSQSGDGKPRGSLTNDMTSYRDSGRTMERTSSDDKIEDIQEISPSRTIMYSVPRGLQSQEEALAMPLPDTHGSSQNAGACANPSKSQPTKETTNKAPEKPVCLPRSKDDSFLFRHRSYGKKSRRSASCVVEKRMATTMREECKNRSKSQSRENPKVVKPPMQTSPSEEDMLMEADVNNDEEIHGGLAEADIEMIQRDIKKEKEESPPPLPRRKYRSNSQGDPLADTGPYNEPDNRCRDTGDPNDIWHHNAAARNEPIHMTMEEVLAQARNHGIPLAKHNPSPVPLSPPCSPEVKRESMYAYDDKYMTKEKAKQSNKYKLPFSFKKKKSDTTKKSPSKSTYDRNIPDMSLKIGDKHKQSDKNKDKMYQYKHHTLPRNFGQQLNQHRRRSSHGQRLSCAGNVNDGMYQERASPGHRYYHVDHVDNIPTAGVPGVHQPHNYGATANYAPNSRPSYSRSVSHDPNAVPTHLNSTMTTSAPSAYGHSLQDLPGRRMSQPSDMYKSKLVFSIPKLYSTSPFHVHAYL